MKLSGLKSSMLLPVLCMYYRAWDLGLGNWVINSGRGYFEELLDTELLKIIIDEVIVLTRGSVLLL